MPVLTDRLDLVSIFALSSVVVSTLAYSLRKLRLDDARGATYAQYVELCLVE
jgi:hypothetical protein